MPKLPETEIPDTSLVDAPEPQQPDAPEPPQPPTQVLEHPEVFVDRDEFFAPKVVPGAVTLVPPLHRDGDRSGGRPLRDVAALCQELRTELEKHWAPQGKLVAKRPFKKDGDKRVFKRTKISS